MAGAVHDMTGRQCATCGHTFTKSSMNLTISKKEKGLIVKLRVCGKCFNTHHSKGE